MNNVYDFQKYKARRDDSKVCGVRLGDTQYLHYFVYITQGWELKRIRLVEGEPIAVMENNNEVMFIEYDGFIIKYDKDTIEAP